MSTWNIRLTCRLKQPLDEDLAQHAGSHITRADGVTLGLVALADDGHRYTVALTADSDDSPGDLGRDAADTLDAALATVGATVDTWEAVEVLSPAEVERRTARLAIPEMVDAKRFAELCDVRVQRIYELEAERKAGRRSDFPTPVVPGYWLATAAERFAATRSRKPGPVPKTSSS